MADQITQTKDKVHRVEFRAMGSQILAAVESGDPEAAALLAEVPGWFAEWEQTLSRFREDSELALLNGMSGSSAPVPVSDTLWRVLQLALQAAHYTGGLVTPTVLASLEAAGYDSSFDEMMRESASGTAKRNTHGQEGNNAGAGKDWRKIRMYPDTRAVRLPRGARLDLGGVAKGWAADEAVNRLAERGPAIVNAGGDIAVSGSRVGGLDWPIGVDAPLTPAFAPGAQIELLSIRSGGIATSGRDYRRWQQGGEWRHHIIDPRTGAPANSDVLAATVVAPTACVAEIGAKVALLLGSGEGLKWLEARPSLAGLLALENGQIIRSRRLGNYLWSTKYGN